MSHNETAASQALPAYWVALFRRIDSDFDWVSEFGFQDSEESTAKRDTFCPSGYVRVSEFTRVEFRPLSSDEAVQTAIANVQQERARVAQEFTRKLSAIDEQLSKLRAITFQAPQS